MKKIALVTLVALVACARSASADSTITYTASPAPEPGSANVTNYSTYANSENGGNDYSNNPAVGQTFVTGSNTLGYTLNSVTVEGTGSAGNDYQGDTYALAIYSVSNTNELTYLGGGDYNFADTTGATDYSSGYLTFGGISLPEPLAPGGTYAYSINVLSFNGNSTGGYYGFASTETDASSPTPDVGVDTYAAGTAFNSNQVYAGDDPSDTSADPTDNPGITYFTSDAYDRDFDIGLTPLGTTPEPQTWALLGMGLAALIVMARRRLNA
jgi:hypothetical protein